MAPSTPPPDGSSPSLPVNPFESPSHDTLDSLSHTVTNIGLSVLKTSPTIKGSEEPLPKKIKFTYTPEKVSSEDSYLDPHRLIKADVHHEPIDPIYLEFFLNQAAVLEYLDKTDPAMQTRLSLIALHAFSKAAPVGKEAAQSLDLQTTPFLEDSYQYNRTTTLQLLEKVNADFSQDMGMNSNEMFLVDGPLYNIVMHRDFFCCDINSIADFESQILQLLENFNQGYLPPSPLILNISKLIAGIQPPEIQALIEVLENILMASVEQNLRRTPSNANSIGEELVRP